MWQRLGLLWMKLPRLSYLGVFGDRPAIVLVPASSIHTHAPSSCLLRVFFGKSTHILSNYHSIVNVPSKLPIVSISLLKLPKNIKVPLRPTKRQK
jgi:hypothetical protein